MSTTEVDLSGLSEDEREQWTSHLQERGEPKVVLVTAQHIAEGQRGGWWHNCAIGKALHACGIFNDERETVCIAESPEAVKKIQQFARDFDAGKDVQPFELATYPNCKHSSHKCGGLGLSR